MLTRGAVLLLIRAFPVTGLLGSWSALGPRLFQRGQRPCTGASLATSGAALQNKRPEVLLDDLLELFQGEFDNYDQVVEDRRAGMAAGPGGGHEHIHCSLKPLNASLVPEQVATAGGGGAASSNRDRNGEDGAGAGTGGLDRPRAVVAAKYYFNGDSNVVFRYRLYSFHLCPPNTPGARGDVVMRLWRMLPSVETRLRAAGYDLTYFDWHGAEVDEPLAADGAGGGATKSCGSAVVEHILGCEIYWSRHGDNIRGDGEEASRTQAGGEAAAWLGEGRGKAGVDGACSSISSGDTAAEGAPSSAAAAVSPEGESFVGLMGQDDSGTWVQSQNVAGLEILVKDDLRVWSDQLWVNDRGFDREGNFLYGNQRSVPYKMRRVVAPGPLAWTLGPEHRTKEAYAEKMSAIGVVPGQRMGPPVRPAAAK
eukprot:g7644.t1